MEKLETLADIESVHPVYEYHLGHRVVRFYDPDFHIIKVGKELKIVYRRFWTAASP